MADSIITKQELIDAQKDAQTLEEVISGEPGKLVETRLGRMVYTLASVPQINTMTREEINTGIASRAPQATTYTKTEVDSALSQKAPQSNTYTKAEVDTTFAAYVGGRKAYTTLALAQAAQSSLPANTAIEVTNDGANNGTYQWNGTTLTKSAYDPKTQAISEANIYTDIKTQAVTQNTRNNYIAKYFADESDLLLVITDVNGNLTWVQIDRETGLPTPQTAAIIRDINKISIIDGDIQTEAGEKVAIALRDSAGNLTALTVRQEDGMFVDAVIEDIKQRLNAATPDMGVPSDFRVYDTTSNIHLFKSVSSAVIRHINDTPLPSTPYDFVDSLGQGARIYLPSNYDDSAPIPLVMVFDGVGGSGGSEPPTVRSQFTSVLLQNGIAICKSQAHGNSYGNPACMQSYLEVFQKACEIAPIGAVILTGNSMGGIAAQNALLTNTIPNISGLYLTDPTYDLRQRYDNGRKPEITAAYDIASDGSDYAEKTSGYDPALRHWSHYRSIPIHIRASSGDTSVVLALHGQKLKTYLSEHNDVTLVDTGTAGHNTSDRFNGEELLSFIKKCTKLV